MLFYFSLLIPLIFVGLVYLFFKSNLNWKEVVMIVLIPIIITFTSYGIGKYFAALDEEWRGTYAVSAWYYEDWNEYIHKTCSRESCSGSGKNRSCTTTYYDCSYVKYHPEYWEMIDNEKNEHNISKNFYEELKTRWNNQSFKDLGRRYHTNDGDAYFTLFNSDFNLLEPITVQSSYENRIAVSNSIFNSRIKNDGSLFDYPKVEGFRQKCLLGLDNQELDLKLQKINALIGKDKQIRIYVIVWTNQNINKALEQEQHWKGGNKNELVINIGIDENNYVTWAYVFSWTKREDIKNSIKSHLEFKPLNINKFLDWLPGEVNSKWEVRDFKEFDYIQIEPSMTSQIIMVLLNLVSTIGLCVFSIKNTMEEYD